MMLNDIRTALDKSIIHWQEMITWVKKQDQNDEVDMILMEFDIHQHWGGQHCELCTITYFCKECPIAVNNNNSHRTGRNCCDEWVDVQKTIVRGGWKDWLIKANIMLELLIKLRDERGNLK